MSTTSGSRDGRPSASISQLIDRRGRYRLAYEPVADLARGVICGFEAVERFPGAIHADRWRAEALERGLEPDLDAFVVGSVLEARESLPGDSFLSFDIRPDTLLRAPVRAVLGRAGRLDNLVVELRPSIPDGAEDALVGLVATLRRAGATIAVDHVGAGSSTLRHLTTMRPDFVKVDPALVRGVHRDDARRALLEAVGRLASRLDASIVALGVERIEELDVLVRLRIPLAQGPLLGVRAKTLTNVAFPLGAYLRERAASRRPTPSDSTGGPGLEPG